MFVRFYQECRGRGLRLGRAFLVPFIKPTTLTVIFTQPSYQPREAPLSERRDLEGYVRTIFIYTLYLILSYLPFINLKGASSCFLSFSFQLADEGASPPFHPFREFLGRIGISVSPPEVFPPSPLRSPQRIPQEFLDKVNKQIADGTFCSDMDSSSPQPQDTQNTQQPTGWARPADYDSKIESWFDDIPARSKADKSTQGAPSRTTKAAPPRVDKGKKIVEVSSSPPHPSPRSEEDSSPSQGAPSRGFIISSPDTSPEPYEHPTIEAWEEDVDWGQFEDADDLSPRRIENIKRKAGKLSCVDQDSYISWDELDWIKAYYHMEGKSVVPKDGIRPHRFDKDNIRIPRMVTSQARSFRCDRALATVLHRPL